MAYWWCATAFTRLNSLTRIVALGQEATADSLFATLTSTEQAALFAFVGEENVEDCQVLVLALTNDSAALDITQSDLSSDVLRTLATFAAQLDPQRQSPLAIAIESWLRGREHARGGNLEQARIEFSVALALDDGNRAVRFERAQAALRLDDSEAAFDDLTVLLEMGG